MSGVDRQRGIGMLEVLVALFIVGIGVLGATAFSVQAYRLENRALLRARIGLLAADLAGRISSNTAGLAAYGAPPADNHCSSDFAPAVICTPAELAADDLLFFESTLSALAPGAVADLRIDETALPPTGVLSVEWRDGQALQTYRMDFAP